MPAVDGDLADGQIDAFRVLRLKRCATGEERGYGEKSGPLSLALPCDVEINLDE